MTDIPIPEDPAASPRSGGGLLYRIQPLLTLLIAIAAITLAVWEGLENRRHNRLTVQPRLNAAIDAGRNPEGEYVRLAIESNGLGPAVLTRFLVYLDGVPQDTNVTSVTNPWANVIETVGSEGMSIDAQAFGAGSYIAPEQQFVLFEATRPRAVPGEPLAAMLDRIAVQICYCSIYGTDCAGEVLTTDQDRVDEEPCPREWRRSMNDERRTTS